jgi:hypothetical protein
VSIVAILHRGSSAGCHDVSVAPSANPFFEGKSRDVAKITFRFCRERGWLMPRHREEREIARSASDKAIQLFVLAMDCFASFAMTMCSLSIRLDIIFGELFTRLRLRFVE